jgi:integrase
MKVAQELMRHSSITTTMDVYTGTVERDKSETTGRLAAPVLGNVQCYSTQTNQT